VIDEKYVSRFSSAAGVIRNR